MAPTRLKSKPREKTSEAHSVRACVLIRVRHGRHFHVADEIATFSGVKSAFAVVGAADVVARIEAPDMRTLVSIGTRIGDLEDVTTTETFVAAET